MSKESTKDLIIETASKLFYAKGYNLVGINEIIDKSGIAKATLYNHFKSKEDLCIAYLDKKDSAFLKDIDIFCNKKTKGNKRLIAILEFLLQFFNSKHFNGCWCLRTLAEVPRDNLRIRKKVKKNKQIFFDFISVLVDENKEKLSKKQKESLSKSIYMLYEGAVVESHVQDDSWPILNNIDLLKMILNKK